MAAFTLKRTVVILVLAVLFTSSVILISRIVPWMADRQLEGNPKNVPKVTFKAKPKIILFYTELWGSKFWPGFETTERFNNWGNIPCKVQNCKVTYNKALMDRADVVIFHAFDIDMVTPQHLQILNKRRPSKQVWIYFMHESPFNAKPRPYLYDGFFNWTMNYRLDADITVLYNWEWGAWEPRLPSDPPYRQRNHAEGKDLLVYAGLSHCGPIREKYIKKLQEYLRVDIVGKCAKRFTDNPIDCPRGSEACNRRLSRYKFFLAFENTFCVDYATEKYWETLLDGRHVPIVLGGANYNEIGVPKSFIDVLDFDTVEDFADHIKYLDENDDVYNQYFAWKSYYKLGPARSWSCKICEKANDGSIGPKTYTKLGSWYSPENNCGVRLERLRQILKNSNVPQPYTDEYNSYEWD